MEAETQSSMNDLVEGIGVYGFVLWPIGCLAGGILAWLTGRRIVDARRSLLFKASVLALTWAPGAFSADGSAPPFPMPAWGMVLLGLFYRTSSFMENKGPVSEEARRWYLRNGVQSVAATWLAAAAVIAAVRYLRRPKQRAA